MAMSDRRAGGVEGVSDEQARWRALAALRDDAIRIVRRRIAQPHDAEDHVHEAMVRLAQRPIVVSDTAQLRSLLVKAACCIAIDRHRHAGRQLELLGRLAGGGQAPSPEDVVADRSEARWLAAGLGALGSMEYDALLHAIEGRRPGEIAALLGVEYKAAENALGRARRKLRLLAASAAMGVAGLVRRLQLSEHPAGALTASTLAAALLLLSTGGARPAVADHMPAAVAPHPAPLALIPVSVQIPRAAPPAAPVVVAATVHAAAMRTTPARPPAVPPAPQPSPGPLPNVPPPWQGSPGVQAGKLRFPTGSPEAWLILCAEYGRCGV